MIKII